MPVLVEGADSAAVNLVDQVDTEEEATEVAVAMAIAIPAHKQADFVVIATVAAVASKIAVETVSGAASAIKYI